MPKYLALVAVEIDALDPTRAFDSAYELGLVLDLQRDTSDTEDAARAEVEAVMARHSA